MSLLTIVNELRRLADLFDLHAKQDAKPEHLSRNVAELTPKAGRLLLQAIDAGAFPKADLERNGAWWDRAIGRIPGGPFVAHSGGFKWSATDGGSGPDATITGTPTHDQARLCWTFAVGSWLIKAFPQRFRQGGEQYDWTHIARDAEGHPVDASGRRIGHKWFLNGEPIDGDAVADAYRTLADGDTLHAEADGKTVTVESQFDRDDVMAHCRAQADVNACACRLLAHLIEAKQTLADAGTRAVVNNTDAIDALVTLDQAAGLVNKSKRTLEHYLRDGKLPTPDLPGGGGKAHRWYWSKLRPALQEHFRPDLPERFPSSRVV